MDKRIHIIVEGRVIEVSFRDSIRRWANLKKVRGWVKNLKNGKLEALFEGESEDVEYMISFCRRGPPLARINAITVEEEPYCGEFESFEVVFD